MEDERKLFAATKGIRVEFFSLVAALRQSISGWAGSRNSRFVDVALFVAGVVLLFALFDKSASLVFKSRLHFAAVDILVV